MNVYDAMKALVAVQERISITSPEPREVRKAWPFVPPQSELTGVAMPCWTNSWDFVRETRSGMLRQMDYTVNMRLHVGQASRGSHAKLAEIALAFLPQVLVAFGQTNAATGLGGIVLKGDVNGTITPTCSYTNIRGGSPTVTGFGEGEMRTIGLDLFLDIAMSDSFVYS